MEENNYGCFRCGERQAIKGKVYCKMCLEDLRRFEELQALKEIEDNLK